VFNREKVAHINYQGFAHVIEKLISLAHQAKRKTPRQKRITEIIIALQTKYKVEKTNKWLA